MVDLFMEGQVLTEMDKGEESLEKEGWDISKSTIWLKFLNGWFQNLKLQA